MADGLAGNQINSIAIDSHGNKWFGTDNGVSELSADGNEGIETLSNKNQLNLYPNPVQNVLHINLPVKTGTLEVFDNSGKSILLNQILDNNTSVDISGLVNGIYLVKVLADNQIYTGKIVKY